MILLRLQTITSCKTITSITDICLLFSLQFKPSIAVGGILNSNQRTDSPEGRPSDLGTKNLQKYHPYTPKAFYFSFIKPQ